MDTMSLVRTQPSPGPGSGICGVCLLDKDSDLGRWNEELA